MQTISSQHKRIHIDTLALARQFRADGARHARLMELARAARFYFSQFRAIGD